ncbi:helix-turn-helix domain-containing protein [Chryseobacterium sp.]|uniref:helix-turn-helix domain-containing protein n=1 Tax=Chryseobacterium sp. TaxID=1871047 RepID=UPI00321B63A2
MPDYKKIFSDILDKKFPEKINLCKPILHKKELSQLDVITLNNRIHGRPEKSIDSTNQKLKAYNETTILEILNYQKEYQLNNVQLANHFCLSRNTVAAWKKRFLLK